MNTKMG